jgi:hypothetical protein
MRWPWLLAASQAGSMPELDKGWKKHFLPGTLTLMELSDGNAQGAAPGVYHVPLVAFNSATTPCVATCRVRNYQGQRPGQLEDGENDYRRGSLIRSSGTKRRTTGQACTSAHRLRRGA